MKNFFFSGLAAGVSMFLVMFAFGIFTNMFLPGLVAEYDNTAIFRLWSDPLTYYMYLHPILMGFVLAFAWRFFSGFSGGEKSVGRGAMFGLKIWVLFGIPGMLMTLSTFNVSLLMVLSWTVSVLAQYVIGGIVVTRVSK